MTNIAHRRSPSTGERTAAVGDLALMTASGKLLLANGQTTEGTVATLQRLADRLGFRATVLPRWGELTIRVDGDTGARYETIAVDPVGVDMHKVAATTEVIDELCDGHMTADTARSALETVERLPSVSVVRFAFLAAAGAAALGVIFGAEHLLSLVLIALSAGVGACVRRGLAAISDNLFVQPLCAALLAGVIGAIAVRLELSSLLRLVAVCPCMVLVPGPHLLNGTLDLVHGRIALGASRIGYASLIVLVICTGLLLSLSLGGVTLPVSEPSRAVPLVYDVLAAGVAVAAYGTFFAMPWRMLPIPILTGMLAHAARWGVIANAGATVAMGALVACLIVGIVVTPIASRLRLPFAAVAFASVVSLIPGVFLFRMAGGLVGLTEGGGAASPQLLVSVVSNGTTAMLIMLAMTFGLIVPKLCIERLQGENQWRSH